MDNAMNVRGRRGFFRYPRRGLANARRQGLVAVPWLTGDAEHRRVRAYGIEPLGKMQSAALDTAGHCGTAEAQP